MPETELRDLAVAVAWSYYGTWYKWGGDDPSGIDCSGFILEILKSVGLVDHTWDATADTLKDLFFMDSVAESELKPGCLVFWMNGDTATHIEMIIEVSPQVFLIGASGGGPEVLTEGDAIKANAFVKIRPLHYRKGPRIYVDPFDGSGKSV